MFSEEELNKMNSSWVYPSGEIQFVAPEGHDDDLPIFCKTIKDAENSCLKISCCWGYDAPISEIYLPRKLTTSQAQVLVKLNESLKHQENINIEKNINIWHHGRFLSAIVECN